MYAKLLILPDHSLSAPYTSMQTFELEADFHSSFTEPSAPCCICMKGLKPSILRPKPGWGGGLGFRVDDLTLIEATAGILWLRFEGLALRALWFRSLGLEMSVEFKLGLAVYVKRFRVLGK